MNKLQILNFFIKILLNRKLILAVAFLSVDPSILFSISFCFAVNNDIYLISFSLIRSLSVINYC